MKYKIEPTYVINYEVHDEDGNLVYNDRGDNLFDTKEEAEDLINILKLDETIRRRQHDATNTND